MFSPLRMCFNVSMMADYRHNKGSVVMLKYHLVWIPRRRRSVLVGAVAERLGKLLYEKAEELNVGIERLAIRPDHLHLFVNAPPSLAVSQIVYRFKGYTSGTCEKSSLTLRRCLRCGPRHTSLRRWVAYRKLLSRNTLRPRVRGPST